MPRKIERKSGTDRLAEAAMEGAIVADETSEENAAADVAGSAPPARAIVRQPSAELAHARHSEALPGFVETYDAVAGILARDPGKGWPTAGGAYEYRLARHGFPRVRVLYKFTEDAIVISTIEAVPWPT